MDGPAAAGVPRLSRPRLTVVVPTYNGRHLLGRCLDSLGRHMPGGVEVVVVDDASTDRTDSWLLSAHPYVVFRRMERNVGFVSAANAGLALVKGEYVQLLNNDAEVTAGWAEAGLRPFDDPRVGSVAPLVLVRSDPSRVDSAGDSYALFGWPSKRGHGQPARRWAATPPGPVFGASGSSAFYRASALARVGGYDPTFGSYYEDVDLSFRLRWAGYICMYAPGCVVRHDISATYDHARPDLQRRISRNAEWLFWSNLPAPTLLLALIPHLGFVAAQAAVKLLRGRLGPFAAGKLDAIRGLSTIRARRALRRDLAAASPGRPHFPIEALPLGAILGHRRRPRETSR